MTGVWVRGCLFIAMSAGCLASPGLAQSTPAATASSTTASSTTQTAPAAMSAACQVIELAYATAINSPVSAGPGDVGPYGDVAAFQMFRLDGINAVFRDRLGLQPAELAELQARAAHYAQQNFEPDCPWQGAMAAYAPTGDQRLPMAFANPVFSADGRLAITQMKFSLPSLRARAPSVGMVCVARAGADGWTAVCQQSWAR